MAELVPATSEQITEQPKEALARKKGGRAPETVNIETKKLLAVYISFRDEGLGDGPARDATIKALHLVPLAEKRKRAALDRAVRSWLSKGNYTGEQAGRFRNEWIARKYRRI
jgi:hypothetical protein